MQNQYNCGSCWAHAAVGLLESQLLLQRNDSWDLSEQQLME
jgi:C1A family cysteine protease